MDKNSKKIFADCGHYTGHNNRTAACLIWPIGHRTPANNPQPNTWLLIFGNVKRISIKNNFKSDKSKKCRFLKKSRFLKVQMVAFCKWVASVTQNNGFASC